MTLSVRSRFEVFKRDGYTCGYCGRTPDDEGVKLVVDHIHPRSAGGSDDIANLVTSCWECNSGKSNKSLEDKAPSLAQGLAHTRERALQLDEYRKWQATLDDVNSALIRRVWDEWIGTFGGRKEDAEEPGFTTYTSDVVGLPQKASLLRHFDKLEVAQIIDAIHGTYRKWAKGGLPDWEVQRYFFGTLKRKREQTEPPVGEYQTGEDNGAYLENRRLRDLFLNHEAHGFATYADVVYALWPSND